jgi:hypothetical protein
MRNGNTTSGVSQLVNTVTSFWRHAPWCAFEGETGAPGLIWGRMFLEQSMRRFDTEDAADADLERLLSTSV